MLAVGLPNLRLQGGGPVAGCLAGLDVVDELYRLVLVDSLQASAHMQSMIVLFQWDPGGACHAHATAVIRVEDAPQISSYLCCVLVLNKKISRDIRDLFLGVKFR